MENPPEVLPEGSADGFAKRLASIISSRLSNAGRQPGTLRVSNLGEKCDRRLWYYVHHPELAEPLSGQTRLKFLFGDILEALLLFLSRLAGHEVTHEQHEVDIDGVKGHTDALIDGELVDVKSASDPSFDKFVNHQLEADDSFGYLDQLGAYGSRIGDGKNHFLVINKVNGNLHLDTWDKSRKDYSRLVSRKREVLANPERPPRGYTDEAHQKSGNRKLNVPCSYCPFKFHCWPNLRVAYYSRKPVFLTVVKREPNVRIENA